MRNSNNCLILLILNGEYLQGLSLKESKRLYQNVANLDLRTTLEKVVGNHKDHL